MSAAPPGHHAGSPAAELRDAAWLVAAGTVRVLALLNDQTEQARVVGGAVRNALLGLPVGDIDIATTAHPDEVIRRARAAGIKFIPTGVDHGTVTLLVDSQPFEVTTLREDVETFGRKARVAFGRDWQRDAERRDFTVNALSVTPDGTVYDYVGGRADIAARRIRFIGRPDQRIAEDYLRILRFFRMHAAYGQGAPDHAGLEACIVGRYGLAALSAERIRAEILKLLIAPGAAAALRAMGDAGLLLRLFGGISYHPALDAMVAAEHALGLTADPIRRLGALAMVTVDDAERLARRLRLSNVEAKQVDSMAYRWWRLVGLDEVGARRRLYRLGPDRYRDRMLLAAAHCAQISERARLVALADLPQRWPVPQFPLKAADLIARGLAPGPALGRALAQAEDDWIEAGFPDATEQIAAIAVAAARAALQGGGPT